MKVALQKLHEKSGQVSRIIVCSGKERVCVVLIHDQNVHGDTQLKLYGVHSGVQGCRADLYELSRRRRFGRLISLSFSVMI